MEISKNFVQNMEQMSQKATQAKNDAELALTQAQDNLAEIQKKFSSWSPEDIHHLYIEAACFLIGAYTAKLTKLLEDPSHWNDQVLLIDKLALELKNRTSEQKGLWQQFKASDIPVANLINFLEKNQEKLKSHKDPKVFHQALSNIIDGIKVLLSEEESQRKPFSELLEMRKNF